MLIWIDWLLIGLYLVLAFGVGFAMKRKASLGLESYFIADRSLPWWWLGTSMVATTFASDTPLVVTGFVAQHGVSGNWFWWSPAIGLLLLAVIFARGWSASGVVTDAELTELRYSGKPAAFLRAFKAFFGSVFVNCIVLGWVFAAMAKITRPFIAWDEILGTQGYEAVAAVWPNALLFESLDNTLTILALVLIVVIYSTAGGIRGVIFTDLIQFTIAMIAAVLFAWYAVAHIGGLDGLWLGLRRTYPADQPGPSAAELTAFWPGVGEGALMSLGAFFAGIGALWWANSQVDGSGYLAQRVNTARSERDAERGALWFCFVNFVVRTWPWVLVGLVALVVFPLHDPEAMTPLGGELEGDREMAYPLLMKLVLPPGILGFCLLSLIAAFMSTVDTHINWGASYLASDLYRRFFRPDATQKEFVLVSRLSVVFLSVAAVLIASQIDQVGDMWKFYFAMMAGLGVPHILRWVWWRANAWTEIAGMSTGVLLSVPAYAMGWAEGVAAEYVIALIASASALVAVVVTFSTPPVPEPVLLRFAERVRPVGFWGALSPAGATEFRLRLLAWVTGIGCVFGCMFAIGLWLERRQAPGAALFALGLASGAATLRFLHRAEVVRSEHGRA